jgi:hypothetical protein
MSLKELQKQTLDGKQLEWATHNDTSSGQPQVKLLNCKLQSCLLVLATHRVKVMAVVVSDLRAAEAAGLQPDLGRTACG